MRRIWMALGALLTVLSLVLVRATLPDDALAGVTVIGGTSTLPAGGGSGAASLDAGSVGATLLADGGIAELNLSGALSASLVHYNDAGAISGYITGTSAYTVAGYADGGLTDGSQNVVARGRFAFSPTAFVLEDDPDAGATVVKAIPSFGTEIRGGSASTVSSAAVQCADFQVPDGTTVNVLFFLNGNQTDGGGLNSATYVRLGSFEKGDGGIVTMLGGAFSNLGTDREDDTSWTGPGAPTFDGGVVAITAAGAASQTISWDCFLQLFYRPRAVRPL